MLVILVAFAQTVETRCSVENEDVDGAAPTGDAPTISEWWTFLLPTKVHLVLDFWEYALKCIYRYFDEIINIDCTTICQNDNFLLSQTKSLFPCTWCMYIRYLVLSYFIDVASTLYLEFCTHGFICCDLNFLKDVLFYPHYPGLLHWHWTMWSNASEVTLKDIDKNDRDRTTTNLNEAPTLWTFLGIYCIQLFGMIVK